MFVSLQSGFIPKGGVVPLEEVVQNGNERLVEEGAGDGDHQNSDLKGRVTDGNAMGDQEDDGASVSEIEKGAGVYLDGEQLTEDELVQVWEEISEGRIGMQEANDFVSQLTDSVGQPLNFQRLSEIADVVRAREGAHPENEQAENSGSPERGVESKYEDTAPLDIEVKSQSFRDQKCFATQTLAFNYVFLNLRNGVMMSSVTQSLAE